MYLWAHLNHRCHLPWARSLRMLGWLELRMSTTLKETIFTAKLKPVKKKSLGVHSVKQMLQSDLVQWPLPFSKKWSSQYDLLTHMSCIQSRCIKIQLAVWYQQSFVSCRAHHLLNANMKYIPKKNCTVLLFLCQIIDMFLFLILKKKNAIEGFL